MESPIKNPAPFRRRLWYAALLLLTMLLGLASRRSSFNLPRFLSAYAGDTLWALLVFWLLGFVFVAKSSRWVAGVALGFAFLIEISQLYQAPWLNAARATLPGRLVLGQGFLWTDFLCYTVGVALGWLLEAGWCKTRTVDQTIK